MYNLRNSSYELFVEQVWICQNGTAKNETHNFYLTPIALMHGI